MDSFSSPRLIASCMFCMRTFMNSAERNRRFESVREWKKIWIQNGWWRQRVPSVVCAEVSPYTTHPLLADDAEAPSPSWAWPPYHLVSLLLLPLGTHQVCSVATAEGLQWTATWWWTLGRGRSRSGENVCVCVCVCHVYQCLHVLSVTKLTQMWQSYLCVSIQGPPTLLLSPGHQEGHPAPLPQQDYTVSSNNQVLWQQSNLQCLIMNVFLHVCTIGWWRRSLL